MTDTSDADMPKTAGFHFDRLPRGSRFSFAVIPDRSGNIRPGVFRRIAEQVNLLAPDFAVFIGDAIEIYGSQPDESAAEETLNEQWDEFERELAPLSRPVYMVPGWHDYKSACHAAVYRKRLGADYYSWDYQGCHFVTLNCYDAFVRGEASRDAVWRIGETQLAWFEADLEANQHALHTFVFVHAFYESVERREITQLLLGRPFTIISGSSHCYRKLEFNGITYYQVGTAGGYSPLEGEGNGTVDHFTWVTVADGAPSVANVLIDSVLPDDFCTDEKAADYDSGEVILPGRMSLWDD